MLLTFSLAYSFYNYLMCSGTHYTKQKEGKKENEIKTIMLLRSIEKTIQVQRNNSIFDHPSQNRESN